jgi:uncharacterized protein (UPF0303 family)
MSQKLKWILELDMDSNIPSLDDLIVEQKKLELRVFDYDFVWELGGRLYQRARSESLPVAIEIRHGSDIVFAMLAPGGTIDNFDWARRKSAVVHRFHRSSLHVKLQAQADGYDFNSRFRLPLQDYAAGGGGYPLILKGGAFIGSVGVSGLPDIDDHKLITHCLADLLATGNQSIDSRNDAVSQLDQAQTAYR